MKRAFRQLLGKAVKAEGKKSIIKMGDALELMAIIKKLCKSDPDNLKIILDYFYADYIKKLKRYSK